MKISKPLCKMFFFIILLIIINYINYTKNFKFTFNKCLQKNSFGVKINLKRLRNVFDN